ncbi:hypothetical protein AMTR_s00037p00047000 [Amborella trichopoda]|uniref:Uncharacterized protein n=1 Tax=Amborella trichopoda TaxID=13333 RepID=U5DA86_AMBTC|nr:hypothetical protein AMTR_s00037p00047000 [Amborella trichopoda]
MPRRGNSVSCSINEEFSSPSFYFTVIPKRFILRKKTAYLLLLLKIKEMGVMNPRRKTNSKKLIGRSMKSSINSWGILLLKQPLSWRRRELIESSRNLTEKPVVTR